MTNFEQFKKRASEILELRSNIRAFLLTATKEELQKELEISLERKDDFRAKVVQELIEEQNRDQ